MPTDATNPTNSYRRPAAHHETTHTLEIKRSKFITFITRIETVTPARWAMGHQLAEWET